MATARVREREGVLPYGSLPTRAELAFARADIRFEFICLNLHKIEHVGRA